MSALLVGMRSSKQANLLREFNDIEMIWAASAVVGHHHDI